MVTICLTELFPKLAVGNQTRGGLEDIQIDPHSGSASYSIPIAVTPGRGGIQPNIVLTYNSNNNNDILGLGWTLEFGSIVRSSRNGIPKFDSSDIFVLNQNGSTQELMEDNTIPNRFHPKIENAFLKIERLTSSWQVTDRSGIKYIFGESATDREEANGHVIRWCLNKVEDIHGNYMELHYSKNMNKIYPTEIKYTGNSQTSLSPYARVVFEYDENIRTDVQISYVMGIKLTTAWRLNKIKVYANDNSTERLQRQYAMTYAQSPVTGRSILKSVEQFGSDGTSSLPKATFTYEDNTGIAEPFSPKVTINSNQVVGNNLWNIRTNGNDFFNSNNYILYPRTGLPEESNTGIFSNGDEVAWGPTMTSSSGSYQNIFWTFDSTGKLNDIHFTTQDRQVYAYTYLYLNQQKTLWFQYQEAHSTSSVFIDGALFLTIGGGGNGVIKNITLDPGYHLLEITTYNQNRHSDYFRLNGNYNTLSTFINSTPLLNPQMAADFNGDGFIDIASYTVTTGKFNVALSSGGGFQTSNEWFTGITSGEQVLLGDFNRDGRSDMALFKRATGEWRFAYSNGTGFVNQGILKTNFGTNEDGVAADMDGDGYADIFTFYKSAGQWKTRVALNDGQNHFVNASQMTFTIGDETEKPVIGNFNGDGLIDFGTFKKSTGNWTLKLNTGDITDPFNTLAVITNFGANKETVMADFNYDGLTDLGYYEPTTGKVHCKVSSGAGFGNPFQMPFTFALDSAVTQVQAQDYNGDGMADWVASDETGHIEIFYSQTKIPDLLKSIDNGVGAQTEINYNSSAYEVGSALPFVVPIVKSTTTHVLNESYTTRYVYEGGLWDGAEREFRGFRVVNTFDPDNNYTVTHFHQDSIYKGIPYAQLIYDAQGKLFSKSNTQNGSQILPGGETFVYTFRKDNFVYDGDSTGRRTAEYYYYDENPQYGNITRVEQLGEVDLIDDTLDIGNDKRSSETEYIKNTSAGNWLLGIPNLVVTKDNNGNIVRQSWFYYDGHASNTATPTKGLLTKKEEWGGSDPQDINPVVSYHYDDYGNLLSTTDPLNHTTEITYDPLLKLFPISTKNVLDHVVTNKYYGVNGEPMDDGQGFRGLWGQLKSTTDPNNKEGSRTHDVFGRVIKTISPLDTIDFPTSESSIQFMPTYVYTVGKQRVQHGENQMITAVSFSDGLGRSIQSKSPSFLAGQYTVSGQTEYNSRGLPIKKYLPYFTTNSMNSINPIDPTKPYTSTEYDAMGRVKKSINHDGTYTSIIYDDWKAITFDENGHKHESNFDAYGRLIEKREYTGADGRSPDYPLTTYTLYATTKYEYDSEGNLIKTIDAQNNQTIIAYDKLGRKISMDDPDMGHWEYKYDLNGNLIEQKDANLKKIFFTYDSLNRLTRKYDNSALNVQYTYDSIDDLNSKGRLTDAGYIGGNAEFKYDTVGREIESIKEINGMSYDIKRGYNALNNILEIRYPDAQKVFYEYNDAGQIKSISNDSTLFDMQPRIFKEQSMMQTIGDQSFYRPDVINNNMLTKILDVFEHYILGVNPAYATDFTLDADCVGAWKFNETSGSTATDLCTVNGGQNGTLHTNVVKTGTHYSFNGDGGHVNFGDVTFLDGESEMSFCLDAKMAPGTLGNGYMSLFRKDGSWTPMQWNGITHYWQAVMWTTQINSQGLSLWAPDDGKWHSYCYTYDTISTQRKAFRDGVQFGSTLLDPGSLQNSINNFYIGGNATVESFKGDVRNVIIFTRILTTTQIAELYKKGLQGIGSSDNQYPSVYAGPDQVIILPETAQLNGQVSDDGLPVPAHLTKTWSKVSGPGTVTFSETNPMPTDVRAARSKQLNTGAHFSEAGTYVLRLTVSDGELINSDDLTITVEDTPTVGEPTVFINDIEYNAAGQITKFTYGNGVITQNFYNAMFRLTRIYTVNAQGTVLQDLSYTYDSTGNIKSISDAVNSSDQTFKYDHLNRLTQAIAPESYGTKNYSYDSIGNIMQKDNRTYTYGDGPAGPHAVTRTQGVGELTHTYTYDANGNMLTKQEQNGSLTEYYYDVENRLLDVKKDAAIVSEFKYDGDGGRTRKLTVSENIRFVGSLYEETNNRASSYIFLGNMRIAQINDGKIFYYHTDHLGGTNVLTDKQGVKKQVLEYEPYGKIVRDEKFGMTDEQDAWYHFTSQYHDEESELYFYNARYYDPELGRFITADDIVQDPTNPVTLNRYQYVGNNPVNNIDPSGRSWKSFWKKFGDFFSPFGRAIVTGDWANLGWQLLNVITIAVAPGPLKFAAGLSYASRATSHIGGTTAMEISRGLGYAGLAVSAGYVAWNVGIGIQNWIHEPNAGLILPDGSAGTAADLDQYGEVLIPGVNTGGGVSLEKARLLNLPVFNNPAHGVIADFTESFLQKITGTGSVDRQFAALLSQTTKPIHIIAHSQGTIIAANALTQIGLQGHGLASGSQVSFMAAAISQPRAIISAALGGAKSLYQTRAFDPINILGPNLNPIRDVTGLIGGVTQGAKQHSMTLYGI